MSNKLSIKGLVTIALILSLVTSAMVYAYLKRASVATNKEGYPVIVAKVDIPPRTKITAEMLEARYVPEAYIQPGAIRDINTLVGVPSRLLIVANEQITERNVLLDLKNAGFVGLIPAKKRAITVAVTEVGGVAGFIRPGDYVDIVVVFDKSDAGEHAGNFVLQNIMVLAINRDTENIMGNTEAKDNKDNKDVTKTTLITLAVDPAEEHVLTLADEKGKIRLALRPIFPDVDMVRTETTTPVKQVGLQDPFGNSKIGKAAYLSTPGITLPNTSSQSQPAAAPQPAQVTIRENGPVIQPGITVIRGTKKDIVPYR